jgi:hypothetical protein
VGCEGRSPKNFVFRQVTTLFEKARRSFDYIIRESTTLVDEENTGVERERISIG